MTSNAVRVRFAPSPTGLLHVGNARTALYNWLFARRHGGSFILRIEDTDLERSEARYETQLLEDLHWLGLDWDEGPGYQSGDLENGSFGPYRQSERLLIYAEHTGRLLDEGKAYRCFCTPEELEAERSRAAAEQKPQVYSRRCLRLSQSEIDQNLAAGKPFAVRLKIEDHPLRFHDLVRGDVEFPAEVVSDPVIVRSAAGASAGIPVYNYVVTIDDALMGITHVIRGDDHIPNTPKQVAIYQAFGYKVPEFAHLSTILGADRERLSKRHGATSISTFREMGYLPEALANYLALLGWGAEDGHSETFTLKDLVPLFSLERVTPSPAVFDFTKLNWLNRHYLKQADPQRVSKLAERQFCRRRPDIFPLWAPPEVYSSETVEFLAQLDPPVQVDVLPVELIERREKWFAALLALFVPQVDHLDELPDRTAFVFGYDSDQARADHENAEVLAADSARTVLSELGARARAHSGILSPEEFKGWLNDIKSATGIKGKELFHPARIAITGRHSGPDFDKLIPLIEEGTLLALGIPGVLDRIVRFVGV
ncbi:MAG: glutamate--tRNA ligase [Acidobacteriota bacterium]|nr:glutamate--tRNA ligase [Acidobacteriota bacterium]